MKARAAEYKKKEELKAKGKKYISHLFRKLNFRQFVARLIKRTKQGQQKTSEREEERKKKHPHRSYCELQSHVGGALFFHAHGFSYCIREAIQFFFFFFSFIFPLLFYSILFVISFRSVARNETNEFLFFFLLLHTLRLVLIMILQR